MYISLSPGLIGVSGGWPQAIELAARHGFAGIDSGAAQLAGLSDLQLENARATMTSLGVRPGYFGMEGPVSAPDDVWIAGVEKLRAAAPKARQLGYTRAVGVVLPFSETRLYAENLQFHVERLRFITGILGEQGIRLGLEYVSPLSRRAPYPHHFVRNLEGTLELIAAVGVPNLGLLLDTFHWHCAEENALEIAALTNAQIVAVHLSDVLANRPLEEQVVFERELPGATGVVDLKGFVAALRSTGFDGPVTCEPMNKALNNLDDETALARTSEAMARTIEL